MFNRTNRTNLTTTLAATTLAVGALVVLAAPGTSEAAYNPGVESVHFAACEVGWGFPCSLPAGIDEADVICVKQSAGEDGYEFAAVDGTGSDAEHVWLNTEVAADCRPGYHVWKFEIQPWGSVGGRVSYDGVYEVDSWPGQGVPVPDATSMAETQEIVDVPVSRILDSGDSVGGLTPPVFSEADRSRTART